VTAVASSAAASVAGVSAVVVVDVDVDVDAVVAVAADDVVVPSDPVWAIVPKARTKVASAVAVTRRRIERARCARARRTSAVEGFGVMAPDGRRATSASAGRTLSASRVDRAAGRAAHGVDRREALTGAVNGEAVDAPHERAKGRAQVAATASRETGQATGRPSKGAFRIGERGTTVRREVLGGVATFLTMSYILFVNPAILSTTGLPFQAVAVATALAAAIATLVMALATNLPFALAPGLGLNAVIAFDLVAGRGLEWPVAMAVVVIEGLLALVLVAAGLREAIMRAIPLSFKLAIGVGIGLFIALVGLREGAIVVNDPATGIALGTLTSAPALVALGGIAVAAVLTARGVRGAIIAGVLASAALGLIAGVLDGPDAIARVPGSEDFSSIGDALAPSNLADALTVALIPVIFALFMTDFFDTIGTAVAIGRSGDLTDERGELPNTRRLLLVDSGAAALGGAMGTSSVTTYVESGAGVAEGARTGLASLVTAGLFLLAVFFVPLIAMVGGDVQLTEDVFIHPAIAPALVMVGYLMIRLVGDIDWGSPEDALPAFLVIAGIPLTFSIAAGIGLGAVAYPLVMAARGCVRDVHPLMWVVSALFVVFFAADWLSANVF
jgi:adenine/guanine/hypoxanthine permease